MSEWQTYPAEYRQKEITQILKAVRAGESAALVGLSGAGKSNLVGFLYHRWPLPGEKDICAPRWAMKPRLKTNSPP